uniref:CUB domain-containing protein n=1 Tax=Romanomermis culicivorax TaxID=13658 RepID=A0A915L4C6_ROMCU
MRQHCNMDNALQADPPEVDFIPHTTIRDLNQMYCAAAWCKSNTQTVNDEKQVISFGTADLSLQSYSPPQDCTWLFTAPPGRKIRFQFTGNAFGYNCTRECICRDYLEIRDTVQDMSIKGYRFCCTLLTKRTIISKSNKLLVISHIHSSGSRGFQGLIYLAAENAASGLT